VILGIIGAIIYYISTFLINPAPEVAGILTNISFIGLPLKLVLQIGLGICFLFFLLLLLLLVIELINVRNGDLFSKFLVFILAFLFLFALLLFIEIANTWREAIVAFTTLILIMAIYIHLIEIFVINKIAEIKSRNLLKLTPVSMIIFLILAIFGNSITSLLLGLGPTFVGFYSGSLIGTFIGMFFCALCLILNSLEIMVSGLKPFIADRLNFFRKKH
jgi:hypothetical protein